MQGSNSIRSIAQIIVLHKKQDEELTNRLWATEELNPVVIRITPAGNHSVFGAVIGAAGINTKDLDVGLSIVPHKGHDPSLVPLAGVFISEIC